MRLTATILLAAALAAAPLDPFSPDWVPVASADRDGDGDGDGDGGDRDGGDRDGGDRDGGDRDGDDRDGNGDDRDGDDRDDRDDDDRDDDDRDDDDRARGFFDQLRDLFGRSEQDAGLDEVAPREIVGLDLGPAQVRTLEANGFRVISRRALAALGTTLDRLEAPQGFSEAQALAQARALAPGAAFDFNHLYQGSGSADCRGENCWPLQLVSAAPLAADACVRGAPVAIIDTAVDPAHPALRGARIERRSFLSEGLRAAPSDHGTAVAALLVGAPAPGVAPLAPGAALLAAETFAMRDDEKRADVDAIIGALDWAISRRARVIGMSLAGPENTLLAFAVRAAARSSNVFAAAGNLGPSAPPVYPAAYPEVAAVAAVDQRRRAWRGGNRGDYVELAAPGVDVLSAASEGGLEEWTGSSFAVPYAVAAALRARAETRGDPAAARRLMASQALDLGAPGRDPMFGHGLVRLDGGRCW